jgi:hypothetical protein
MIRPFLGRAIGTLSSWVLLTLASCSSEPKALSYHGIAVGITVDSLNHAVQLLTEREPFCLHEGGYDRCTSGNADGTLIYAYVQNGLLKDVQIRRTLTAVASTDSLRTLFAVAWGQPDSLALPSKDWLPSGTTFVSVPLGRWSRRGVLAWAAIHSEPHNPHTEFPFGFLDVQLTTPGFRDILDSSAATNLAP